VATALDRTLAHMVRCLVLQEKKRLNILSAVLVDFELTKDPRDKVRRTEVYDAIARRMGRTVNNALAVEVTENLSGVPGIRVVKNAQVRLFRGLKPRHVLP